MAGLAFLKPLLALSLIGAPALQDDQACQTCHGDAALKEDAATKRLFLDVEQLRASVHGIFSCTNCHQDLAGQEPFGHPPELKPVDCGLCHTEAQQEYVESLHGYAFERGNPKAPGCADCHGSHGILPTTNPDSRSHRSNIPTMCASCHGSQGLLTDQLVRMGAAVETYAKSVHGQALDRGIDGSAACTDCHGAHALKGKADPLSKIHRLNVSSTCGTCHSEAQHDYERSIHGRALAAGISDSPTCNDCHGEHLILQPGAPIEADFALRKASESCAHCHQDPRIITKYGLADYVVDTYVDSYHGWALRRGSEAAADCVDCHLAHEVLPARDPESTIHSSRIVETCGQCHANSNQAFANSYTHRTASIDAHPVPIYIEWIYMVLIPLVIGAMIVHNGVILNFYLQERRRAEKLMQQVVRMDKMQMVQHMLLAASFTGLAITGFALRFPEASWVKALGHLGMDEEARSSTHRILGVLLCLVGAWHLIYIRLSRRGRREFAAMLPRWKDVRHSIETVKYHLRLRKEPVRYERYDYTQKLEYWALVWGTVIMAASGFVLWFPALAVKPFPSWIVMASETIHYYEAWLAVLAVIFWHFFFVLLHPKVYPMSWTWLTGKMTLEEVRSSHPGWYQEDYADAGSSPAAEGDRKEAQAPSEGESQEGSSRS